MAGYVDLTIPCGSRVCFFKFKTAVRAVRRRAAPAVALCKPPRSEPINRVERLCVLVDASWIVCYLL